MESGTENGAELVPSLSQNFFVLKAGKLFVRIESFGICYGSPSLSVVFNDLIERELAMRAQPAPIHERGVDDYPGEPGREPRPTFERTQICISGQQAVLQSVFGVFLIAEQRERRPV